MGTPESAQPRQVAFHGAQTHPEVTRERGAGNWLADRAERLDEPLLPLYPTKGEVVVA